MIRQINYKKEYQLSVDLYEHQRKSVQDLEFREKTRKATSKYDPNLEIESNIGVFGDLPGFGKTLSMVSLISRDKMDWDKEYVTYDIEDHGPASTYILKRKVKKRALDCTLIVASKTLIADVWKKELNRSELAYHVVTQKRDMQIDPDDYNVVIVTDTMYNKFIMEFEDYAWKRFVYDEAASTHIRAMKRIYAGFYWFMSATFPKLNETRGRYHFLKDLFRNIRPDVFECFIVKNDDEFCKQSYKMQEPIVIEHLCLNPGIFNAVKNAVPNNVLEMLAAGDIENALKALGGEAKDNVIDLVKAKKKQELHEAEEKVKKYFTQRNKDSSHRERYKKWTERVSDLKKQLSEIDDKMKEVLEGDCSICYVPMVNPTMVSCCQNMFCGKCILEWVTKNPTCPLCRKATTAANLILYSQKEKNVKKKEQKEKKNIKELKPKPQTIVDIIKKYGKNSKFIVSSSYEESFSLIKTAFAQNDINYFELKGLASSREKKLQSFKDPSGDINVIFLNSKFNGAGINLQCVTDIILYHEMEEALEKQLIGRAMRIGKVGSLRLHRLKDSNDNAPQEVDEIEDKIEEEDDEEIEIEFDDSEPEIFIEDE